MNKAWPTVRLGDVLVERRETPDPEALAMGEIRIVSKIAFDTGRIELRQEAGTKTGMILIRPGDLVLSGINAAKGAIAVFGDENHDPVAATIHYGAYSVVEDHADVTYLWWYLRSRVFRELLLISLPEGIKSELKSSRLLPLEIPLPPLSEQRRIVGRIEELAAEIEAARLLRTEAVEEADALVHSHIGRVAYEIEWEMKRLSEVAEINPSRAGNVRLDPSDIVSFVPMRAVDDVTGTIAWPETRPLQEVAKGYTWFTNGDVIFAKITPCMQNGKAALARNLVNGVAFGSTEFHVIRPGKDVCGEWIFHLVRHMAFRDAAAEHFKGTAGQQRVPQSFLDEKLIPVPPLPEQRRIVTELDALQAEVDALKAAQAETAAELDALLPSILDRAFKGELL